MSTQTKNTEKKVFNLEQVFALWRQKTKDGKKTYFSGKIGEEYLTGFYNTKKQNPKEPDIRIYKRDEEGNLAKEEFVSLWCNVTKNGKKLLSGKIDGKRVIGFINTSGNEKAPYISVYWADETETPKDESKPDPKATKTKKAKKEEPKFEEVETDEDLPF